MRLHRSIASSNSLLILPSNLSKTRNLTDSHPKMGAPMIGVYMPSVSVPENQRTFDEKGNRIAKLEEIDGRVVAVPLKNDE